MKSVGKFAEGLHVPKLQKLAAVVIHLQYRFWKKKSCNLSSELRQPRHYRHLAINLTASKQQPSAWSTEASHPFFQRCLIPRTGLAN